MHEEQPRPSLARNLVGLAWLFWAGHRLLREWGLLDDVPIGVTLPLYGIPAVLAPVALALGIRKAHVEANPWPGFTVFLAGMTLVCMNLGMNLLAESGIRKIRIEWEDWIGEEPSLAAFAEAAVNPLDEATHEAYAASGWTRRELASRVYAATGDPIWYRNMDGDLVLFEPDPAEETASEMRKQKDASIVKELRTIESWARRDFYIYLCGLLALMPTTFLFLAMRRTRGQGTGFEG